MNIDLHLRTEIQQAINSLLGQEVENLQIQPTNPEFEGSHTLVCFPLTKVSKKGPEDTAKMIGEYLVTNSTLVARYNAVKGFLNIVLNDRVWIEAFQSIFKVENFGIKPSTHQEIMVEYSSPNTNKPLHLGHLRNNFLGWSVSKIYEAIGYKVHRVQIINDRGIHICKSMAAWKLSGKNETPENTGLKGDKLVGKYYVEFDKIYKAQISDLIGKNKTKEEAEKEAPIMQMAVDMLRKWEQRDQETIELWKTMNGWVYAGFEATYMRMGVEFEKLYYESETYLLGKDEVLKGLKDGVFFKKDDGSVWVDLSADGLDQKVLLRADGTSVYMTQDIGTAILRFRDFPKISKQVYTVGNEQEYHFKVLFLILAKLGYSWARECYHLSYGMVDLPSGRMKSREGTVVDADDLMQEMIEEAERQTHELGKIEDLSHEEAKQLFETIALGALKFYLLKVDPKKRMLFDPAESIQLQGHTGPFIQYTHARICAILRKAKESNHQASTENISELQPAEKELIQLLNLFPEKIETAAKEYSPAIIANFAYDLSKAYNQFYQAISIFGETDAGKLQFRVALSKVVAETIKKSMDLLGINVPERM